MGITDLQFSNWNYAVCKSFEGDNSSGNFGNGYRIDYARTINGVPVTQTIADGGHWKIWTAQWKHGLMKVSVSMSIKMA